MIVRVVRGFRGEDGQGLVELIVALMVLSIGVGALLTVLTSSALSLQRADQKGTALTLAEKQIEIYRNVTWPDIRLDQASFSGLPSSYMNAHTSDPTIPGPITSGGANEVTDVTAGTNPCVAPLPPECMPVQTVTGPDNRQYRIDTYITQVTPAGGDTVNQVFVVVRNAQLTSMPILARSASTFSAVNQANVNGKSITKLALTAPKADLTNTPIPSSSIVATLSGGTTPTGVITFFISPSFAAPCTGASWTQIGTAVVNGNGPYSPSGGYTPTSAGTYYWYATYSGDPNNIKASSPCTSSMAHMNVQGSKWSPNLTLTAPSSGTTGTQIASTAINALLSASSGQTTAQLTFMVYGPSATAPGSCTTTVSGLWHQVDKINPSGDGSYNPNAGYTPSPKGTYWWWVSYPGDATNNAASSTCGSSMAKTVVIDPPDTFSFSNIGSQTAGTQFTATITAIAYGGLTDTTYTGAQTLTFSGPSASPGGNAPVYQGSVTFTAGVATGVTFKLFNAGSTAITATQTPITGTSNTFNVAALAASAYRVANPGTQTAGVTFGTTLTAIDTYGNTDPAYSGTKTVAWANPLNSPNGNAPNYGGAATSVPFTNGVGVVGGITLYNAAATTLKATQGSLTGTSASFTVNSGSITTLTVTNPGAQVAGTSFNVTITGKDVYGNGLAGPQAVSFSGPAASPAPSSTAPSYPATVTFTAGTGTANLTLYKAASTTLTVTAGAASGSTTPFTVAPAGFSLAFTATCGANTARNTSYTTKVTRPATDLYSNPDPNAGSSVSVSVTIGGGGSIGGSPLTIPANGTTSSASATVNNPNGNNQAVVVTATAGGYQSATCSYTTN